MIKALQDVAEDISQSMVREIEGDQDIERATPVSIVDLLLQQLAGELVRQLQETGLNKGQSGEELDARLQKVMKRLEKLAVSLRDDDDEDEVGENGRSFPNLKYAKPKYQNVESILRYVDKVEDKGGVKLVIMNFND